MRPDSRWLSLPEGPTPALLGPADFDLAVRVDDLGVEELRGRYALLRLEPVDVPTWPPGTSATFRVRSRTGPDDPGTVLFEATLADPGGPLPPPVPFTVRLDATAKPAFLALETHYESAPGDHPIAAWIEPVLVGRRPPAPVRAERPWNVLLVTSDTTRVGDLSPYGGPARTDHLAALAERGVVFDNAWSVAFGTTPSHASLMTANPPAIHGVYDNASVLASGFTTLAEVLGDHGWRTGAFVGALPVARSLGLSQGFDVYDDLFLTGKTDGLGMYAFHERRADAVAARFLDWLGTAEDEPFFAWLHFFDPHQPYAPPPRGAPPPPSELDRFFAGRRNSPGYVDAKAVAEEAPDLLPALAAAARERYRGELEHLDSQLGRVLTVLRGRGLEKRTVVVFVADHGETFLERGPDLAFSHGSILASVSHLPLLLHAPDPALGGRRTDLLVGNLDVAPTILDLLGIAPPPTWAGRSVLPRLEGDGPAEFRPHLVLESAHQHEVAVRSGRWLYRELLPALRSLPKQRIPLAYPDRVDAEVYDLVADPETLHPVDPAACPDFARLESIAARYLEGKGRVRAEALDHPEHLEALRALGYLK